MAMVRKHALVAGSALGLATVGLVFVWACSWRAPHEAGAAPRGGAAAGKPADTGGEWRSAAALRERPGAESVRVKMVRADRETVELVYSIPRLEVSGVPAESLAATPTGPVRRTGQTASMPLNPAPGGSDGALQKGAAWPTPRFTDNSDGTVTDNLSGLIWLKNVNAFGSRDWNTALADCAGLRDGQHGLSDGSAPGDWRLPNVFELNSLIAYQYASPALCNALGTGQWKEGDPFVNVKVGTVAYWTSSYVHRYSAWIVQVGLEGFVHDMNLKMPACVWPVRGGAECGRPWRGRAKTQPSR
jgi:hypothetical protein